MGVCCWLNILSLFSFGNELKGSILANNELQCLVLRIFAIYHDLHDLADDIMVDKG